MSKYLGEHQPVSLPAILKKKAQGEKLVVVTCYDSAFGRLMEKAPIDIVLVGDSLGNVMLGYDNTLPVSMSDMIHHTGAVARVLRRPFLVADMPFGSYQASVEQAVNNAVKLVQAGAHAIKLEGGRDVVPQVKAITAAGIPVMAHLGLTPQSIHTLGGYRVQGKDDVARQKLLEEAALLENAGAFSLVLELVPARLAEEVSKHLRIPTIGIGAGSGTDGQVLVLHDLLGFDADFRPKFLKQYANLGETIAAALNAYSSDVREGRFPTPDHSF